MSGRFDARASWEALSPRQQRAIMRTAGAEPAAAPVRIEVPGTLIVSTVSVEAWEVGLEHVAWARARGLSPLAVGAALRRWTPSWQEAAGAVALAWQAMCAWCAEARGKKWRN